MPTSLNLSEVVNVILVLFALFQLWDAGKTKHDLRFGLIAVRDMVENGTDSRSILSALDGNIATLGGRAPFADHAKNLARFIVVRFSKIDKQPLPTPSPMTSADVRDGFELSV